MGIPILKAFILAMTTLIPSLYVYASYTEGSYTRKDKGGVGTPKAQASSLTVSNSQFPDNTIPEVPAGKELIYLATERRGDYNYAYLPDTAPDGSLLTVKRRFPSETGKNNDLHIRGPLFGFEDGIYVYGQMTANFIYDSSIKKWCLKKLTGVDTNLYHEFTSAETSSTISGGLTFVKFTTTATTPANIILDTAVDGYATRVISSESNEASINKVNILDATEDVKLDKGDLIMARWSQEHKKWVLTSLDKSRFVKGVIRKLKFSELSINTGVSEMPFYNNGRMQKPVDIFYRAQLVDDDSDVKLNPEEERYYLNISIVGQDSTTLTSLYPKFQLDQKHNPRYTSIAAGKKVTVKNTERSRLFIRYMGQDSNDTMANLSLCVWSSNSSEDEFNSNTVDCSPTSSTGSIRPISVQSGAYEMANTLLVDRRHNKATICDGWADCNARFRTHDNESNDIKYAIGNSWLFSSPRNHKFRPLDANHMQTLAAGCKDGNPQDGICGHGVWGEFYGTRVTFGHSNLEPISYTIKKKGQNFYSGYQEYSFRFSDLDVSNKFAVINVMGEFTDDSGFQGLVRFVGGQWAGQTAGNTLTFKRRIEDEYGNRFDFQGTLEELPGTNWGSDPQVFLGELRTSDIRINNIYN